MKTRFEFIEFVLMVAVKASKRPSYECRNVKSQDVLGWVSYYSQWRQYVFTAEKCWPIFNNSCLRDIAEFMEGLNTDQG